MNARYQGEIKAGSIVQANENAGEWAGCVLIVSEEKSWGVQAYLRIPTKGDAYIRLPWDAVEDIGEAVLVAADE